MVCRDFILPEGSKPCLFIFAKLILPYPGSLSLQLFERQYITFKCELSSQTKKVRGNKPRTFLVYSADVSYTGLVKSTDGLKVIAKRNGRNGVHQNFLLVNNAQTSL
jgi:hypothetical protein